MKKIILLELIVPDSKYCWEYVSNNICEYFDNEGGHAYCEIFQDSLKRTNDGILKLSKCLSLASKESK